MRVIRIRILSLAAALLLVDCSTSPRQFNSQQNSSPATSSSAVARVPEPVANDYFTILHVSDEPIALLSVRLSNPAAPVKSDLVLEIENISDKTIQQVEYGLWPSEQCADYMYATAPSSPPIAYGNEKAGSNEPPLKPKDKAMITVRSDKALQKLLSAKTYESCPKGHSKPQLMIQEVHFVGGAVWYPNQSLREKSFK